MAHIDYFLFPASPFTYLAGDRLEVLGYLKSVPNLYLFHPTSSEVEKHARHLQRVYRAESWDEILIALI